MTRRISTIAALGLLVLLTLPAQVHALRQADAEARVDELMAEYAEGPGGIVGVVQHGELVFVKAYGLANLEHRVPMTRETVLDIGSTAKQFTAFAVVLLAQEGKLSLDDDIRTYLPAIPDFGPTITIRHLVHHMSGLREIYNALALEGWQAGDGMSQSDALRLTMRMRELNFEPGAEYLYCNTAYALLADIVAEVSGLAFPEFMAQKVFGPVGMTNTTIMSRLGQSIPGAGESYGPTEDGGFVRIFDNSSMFGQGGIYTSMDDMAAWMANYGSGEVGGASAIEQMQQRGVLNSGDTLAYAFGLNIGQQRGLRTFAHGGASAGYRSSFVYYPELDGGVITMSNLAAFDGSIGGQVADVFFGDHMETAPEAAAAEAAPDAPRHVRYAPPVEVLAALAGRYYSPELETIYTLVVEDGKLIAKHRRHDDFVLTPAEEDLYRGASFFGTARFERNQGGEPTGMRVSNGRVRNLLFERLEG